MKRSRKIPGAKLPSRCSARVSRIGMHCVASSTRRRSWLEWIIRTLRLFTRRASTRKTDVSIPFFAMEFVAGAKDIQDYCRARSLDVRERLRLFVTLCGAVWHGHMNSVIHRDLKPANVLVSDSGILKVIDFGVARVLGSGTADVTLLTKPGQIIGTLQYMSPEQCEEVVSVSTRSDIYSLGVMLYELLTGSFPYTVSTTSVLSAIRAIQSATPQRPSQVRRDIHGDIEHIVLKCLEKRPEDRYQSVLELRQDVERYLSDRPISIRGTRILHRARLYVRRNRGKFAMAVIAATIVIAWAVHVGLERSRLRIVEKDRAMIGNAVIALSERANSAWKNRAVMEPLHAPGASAKKRGFLLSLPQEPWSPLGLFAVRENGISAIDHEIRIPEWIGSNHTKMVGPHVPAVFRVEGLFPRLNNRYIVAAYNDRHFSPAVIRVYNMEKHGLERPTIEWWNGGHIRSVLWNQREREFVLCATSNYLVEWVPRLRAHRSTFSTEINAIVLLKPSVNNGRALFPIATKKARIEPRMTIIVRRPNLDHEVQSDQILEVEMITAVESSVDGAVCDVEMRYTHHKRVDVSCVQSGEKEIFRISITRDGRVLRIYGPGSEDSQDLHDVAFDVLDEHELSRLFRAKLLVESVLGEHGRLSALKGIEARLEETEAPGVRRAVRELVAWKYSDADWLLGRARSILIRHPDHHDVAAESLEQVKKLLGSTYTIRGKERKEKLEFLEAVLLFRKQDHQTARKRLKKLLAESDHTKQYFINIPFLCFLEMSQLACGARREASLTRAMREREYNVKDNAKYDPNVALLFRETKSRWK